MILTLAISAEGVVGLGDQRLGPLALLLVNNHARIVVRSRRLRAAEALHLTALSCLLLPRFPLELYDFCRKFGGIIGLSYEALLFHQHLDALLLADHLLLIVHHLHAFTSLMHLC